mgnify:CR=1 FL=1
MPFVTRKFYRGKNVQDEPGSGLALYIVSYIMERMKGGLVLENHEDGLEAKLIKFVANLSLTVLIFYIFQQIILDSKRP